MTRHRRFLFLAVALALLGPINGEDPAQKGIDLLLNYKLKSVIRFPPSGESIVLEFSFDSLQGEGGGRIRITRLISGEVPAGTSDNVGNVIDSMVSYKEGVEFIASIERLGVRALSNMPRKDLSVISDGLIAEITVETLGEKKSFTFRRMTSEIEPPYLWYNAVFLKLSEFIKEKSKEAIIIPVP